MLVMKRYLFILMPILLLVGSSATGQPELIPLGPFGGDVRSLASHPQRPDWVFLGTADGQLFLSKTAGRIWEKLQPGLDRRELVIDSLVFSPDSPDVLYAGGWKLKNDQGELFITKDAGVTWNKVDLGRYESSIRAVALAPTNPEYIAVGIVEGVVVSRDGGKKWNRISRGYRSLYNVHSLAFHPSDENTLFAGTWRLGWKTTDLGGSWARLQKGIYWDSHLFSIQINPESPKIVFAGACSGIYRSLDGGNLWGKLKNGLPSAAKRTRTLRLDPSDAQTVYAGTTAGLYRSVNNGAQWKQLLGDVVVNTILVDPRDSRTVTIGTDDAGVLKSDDYGESFVPVNDGFIQRQVGAVAVQPGSTDTFYAGVTLDRHFGGFFMTRNGGRTWTACNSGLGKAAAKINAILPLESSEELFLATSRGLFRGVPEKVDWALVEGTSGIFVNNLAADKQKSLLFLACRDGIRTLNLVDGKTAVQGLVDLEVTSILVDAERSWIFAGTNQGVFRSRDRGVSWRNTSKGLSGASVEILERAGSRLLCGTKSGLFIGDDYGEDWSPGQGVFPLEIVSIKANPISTDQVVASNVLSGYYFTSQNGGVDWQVTDLGSSLSRISSFAYTAAGELLAGTMTEGVLQIVSQSKGNRLAVARKGARK